MVDSVKKAEQLISDIRKYLDNKVEYYELKAVQKSSKLIAEVFIRLTLLFFLFFVLFFLGIALGFYISALLDSYVIGFLIVSGIFLVSGFVFVSMMKKQFHLFALKLSANFILNKNNEEDN
jgi:hypothetical protein